MLCCQHESGDNFKIAKKSNFLPAIQVHGGAGVLWGSRDGAVVRALVSHQCGPGLIPGPDAISGLSLLLVLFSASRVFLRVLRFSSLSKNQHTADSSWL